MLFGICSTLDTIFVFLYDVIVDFVADFIRYLCFHCLCLFLTKLMSWCFPVWCTHFVYLTDASWWAEELMFSCLVYSILCLPSWWADVFLSGAQYFVYLTDALCFLAVVLSLFPLPRPFQDKGKEERSERKGHPVYCIIIMNNLRT